LARHAERADVVRGRGDALDVLTLALRADEDDVRLRVLGEELLRELAVALDGPLARLGRKLGRRVRVDHEDTRRRGRAVRRELPPHLADLAVAGREARVRVLLRELREVDVVEVVL